VDQLRQESVNTMQDKMGKSRENSATHLLNYSTTALRTGTEALKNS